MTAQPELQTEPQTEPQSVSTPPILYNIAVEGKAGNILIDWGNSPGWLKRHAEELAQAEYLSLLPKSADSPLPVLVVKLEQRRRWILFSRVYGTIPGVRQVRLYCLGWQNTVGGENVKSLLWVYPGGAVECAEEPSWVGEVLAEASNAEVGGGE